MSRIVCTGLRITPALVLTFFLASTLFSQDFVTLYPHSIIPGGVTSPLRYAEQQGRADVGFLRPQYLQKDLAAYVNYKDGSNIQWTAAKVNIKKGELVFADKYGHIVRGRCANDITVDRPPKAFTPPGRLDLDTPEVGWMPPPILLAELIEELPFEFPERWPDQPVAPEQLEAADNSPVWWPIGITALPVIGLIPTLITPPDTGFVPASIPTATVPVPPIPTDLTPEPATLWLFLTAAAFFSGAKLLNRLR